MKTKWDTDLIHNIQEYWINPESREIWIRGIDGSQVLEKISDILPEAGVEYQMANKVIMNLNYLKYIDSKSPVTIHLHTCGGEACQGMAIYDAIKSMPYHITIVGYAEVRSMSSIIFLAGDEKLLMPHSKYMIHYGDLAVSGESLTTYTDFKEDKKFCKFMNKIYSDNSDFTKKQINRMMTKKRNVWFNAKQAVKHGFADGIYE